MTVGERALLEQLVDIGSQDIYTDAPEYAGRVIAMENLIGLAREALDGTPVEVAAVERLALPEAADMVDWPEAEVEANAL